MGRGDGWNVGGGGSVLPGYSDAGWGPTDCSRADSAAHDGRFSPVVGVVRGSGFRVDVVVLVGHVGREFAVVDGHDWGGPHSADRFGVVRGVEFFARS